MLRSARLLLSLALLSAPLAGAQKIAFTWDDLPAHSALPPGETRVQIIQKLIAAMKDAHMPSPYGFINGIRTEQEPDSTPVLKLWRDAGYPLGNHTWSHMNLNQHSLEDFKADLLKNEPMLAANMKGEDWHWLRYPNLAEGDTPEKRNGARTFLKEHGYRIAGVTMSFSDWAWNDPYARCIAKKDEGAKAELEKSYLAGAEATIDYARSMSKALYGHDIPYVLLMHVGTLDSKLLPQLLALYKAHGFTFITLQEAEQDPFYKNDLDPSLPAVPDTLEEAMKAHNLPLPQKPKLPSDLATICR